MLRRGDDAPVLRLVVPATAAASGDAASPNPPSPSPPSPSPVIEAERLTIVPSEILHYTLELEREAFDGDDGTAAAAAAARAVYEARAATGTTLSK